MNYTKFGHQRFFNLGLILVGWTLYGFFFGSQYYVREAYFGRNPNFQYALSAWLTCGYSWALVTFPILYLARRFPFNRENWHRALAFHIPASVFFAILSLTIFVALRLLLGENYSLAKFKSLLVEDLHSGIPVYFGILGVRYAVGYLFEPRDGARNRRSPAFPDEATSNSENGHEQVESRAAASDVSNGSAPQFVERFSVKTGGRIIFISVCEIDVVTSEGNYVKIHTNGRSHLLRETMKAMEQKLDPKEFVRVRRSTIVRIEQIKELHPLFNGEFEIVLNKGTKLSSSRRYRRNLDVLLKT